MVADTNTKERIMEAARLTVQDLGYSGLSFRELAKDVGIKSASIHYYFATKGELGAALASRYTAHYAEYFDGLLAEPFLAMKGAVVSAPVLAGGRKPPRSLDELSGHQLLAVDPPADLPVDLWSGWLSARGYRGPKLPESQKFDTWALMYEAASNGMGITIAVPAVSETYLRDGRLKPCFGGTSDLRMHYSLVYANGALKERPDVRALATRYDCRVIVVSASDGAWGRDPFAGSGYYQLAEQNDGKWRIYRSVGESPEKQ